MFRAIPAALLLLFATGLPLSAQAASASPLSSVTTLWEPIIGYITQVAEETPEEGYAYRPTDEVRSIGQMIGHVAGAQFMMCAAALGEPARGENDIERSMTGKAELVQALKESTEYCAGAYAQPEDGASAMTKLFGRDITRFHALVWNATHIGEHYGNLVTYLRIQGIVPPSSRRGM